VLARVHHLGPVGGSPELIDRLGRRFHRLVLKSEAPITLVGHSLGGIYARELARAYPDQVRQVITLGSPFAVRPGQQTNPLVMRLFQRSSGMVPTTAIYSRLDGVVHWRACREEASPLAENIEVPGSHLGMTVHPTILYVLADRLAQQKTSWTKFRAPGSWRDIVFSPGSTAT